MLFSQRSAPLFGFSCPDGVVLEFTHVHLNLHVLEAAQALPFSLPENAKL